MKRQPRDSILEKTITQREPEYDEDTDRHRRKSTQVRWGRRDGRREPDSGLGYTQDWHSQRRTTDGDRETEGRQTGDRIPETTVYAGIVSGIFHEGEPYSHPTEHTVDRPKAIPRRVTKIGLRRDSMKQVEGRKKDMMKTVWRSWVPP